MKVLKHYVKQWFNHELTEWDGWRDHQEFIHEFLQTKNKSLRFMMYQKHLKIINSNWGVQYSKTIEHAYVRELVSTNRNKEYCEKLELNLKEKLSKQMSIKKAV